MVDAGYMPAFPPFPTLIEIDQVFHISA